VHCAAHSRRLGDHQRSNVSQARHGPKSILNAGLDWALGVGSGLMAGSIQIFALLDYVSQVTPGFREEHVCTNTNRSLSFSTRSCGSRMTSPLDP